MHFIVRPYRRFPVVCDVSYEHGFHEGHGTVWNLSRTGWRISGTLTLRPGDVCSLRVVLSTHKPISVAAGVVRWVRGEDYGIETLVLDNNAQIQLGKYLQARIMEL